MTTAHQFAKDNSDRFLAEYLKLVRIPSVSTLDDHAKDVARAAQWLADDMIHIGFENAEVIKMPEGRCPLVFGQWLGAGEDAPTILVYSHYDVQPAALEDGWDTNPFEPVQRGGKIYARGATDSKIHVMAQLKAVESILSTDEKSPVNIKLIFEGEEESGSENINAFVKEHGERLRADVCVISDGCIVDPQQPSLVYGLRGITTMELHVTGPESDLHSGHYGGNTHNPVQAITEIIAQLHDENGKVTVPGFYDNVLELDAEERQLLAKVNPWVDADWQKVANAPQPWGETEYSLHERIGARPTLEINGIAGGYYGPGFKTVLPSKAMAKISCRLVSDQEPLRIVELVRDYIAQITPPTVRSELIFLEHGAKAVLLDHNSTAMQAASAAYEKGWGKKPIFERAGGSIPITHTFQDVCDEIVIMGFTYKGGRAHGPNENIITAMFYKGIAAAIQFHYEYAKLHKK